MNDYLRWIPGRIYWRDAQPMMDWVHLGARRLTDPFFAQTLNACVGRPADLVYRRQTPLAELEDIAGVRPGLRPAGFIFHLSRCGSTLVAQRLAASPQNVVLSEAGPIDGVLRSSLRDPGISDEQRVRWLRALVRVFGWQRAPAEKQVFIKFDCWHARFLPLIQRAFPEVPWVFLYREPLEVLASARKQPGGHMIPGVLEPGIFDWSAADAAGMARPEYAARVLAKICETALDEARAGRGKLVNYRQLPDGVWPALLDYWQVAFSAADSAKMREAALRDAKNPVMPFAPDSQAKRDSAPAELRALSQRWLEEVYQRLESQRLAGGFA